MSVIMCDLGLCWLLEARARKFDSSDIRHFSSRVVLHRPVLLLLCPEVISPWYTRTGWLVVKHRLIYPSWGDRGWLDANLFTATTCKISGLESADIHASKQYRWWSFNKSTSSAVHFNGNPFACSYEGGKTSLNGFQFGAFVGRLPSDGVASMAVNGLKSKH